MAVDPILADVPITAVLLIWMGFVLFFGTRWLYNFVLKRGWDQKRGRYLGRKFVHIFGAGVAAAILPFEFHEPYLPLVLALSLAVLTYSLHRTNHILYWFQDPANYSETYFTIMFGTVVFATWFLDKTFLLAVVPTLFMAWGDGITGVVRNLKYKKRTKAWEGSLAMLLVCIPIGALLGLVGVLTGVVVTLVERVEWMDDNLSIPLVSLGILIPAYIFGLAAPFP
jgi:phytol kinase